VSASAAAKIKNSKEPAATEAEMLDLLERSLAKPGNGGAGEYGFMRQVRNGLERQDPEPHEADC
jgi:hypothetical protein